MAILDRVKTNINCCGIQVAFAGVAVPSVLSGWQPFYNQTFTGATFDNAYSSISKIDFSEESVTTTAGTYYKQKVSIQFPTTDPNRAERIALLHKVRFIKVLLSDASAIIIGINDIAQNAFPAIKSKSNENLCGIEFEVQSISPAGFTPFINNGSPVIPLVMNPYFETVTYVAGNPQTFDLGLDIIPMVVVINEGRFLKHGTEWIMAGQILTILYDSLEDGDTVSVNGFEGTMNDVAPVYSGDVGPDVGPDVG